LAQGVSCEFKPQPKKKKKKGRKEGEQKEERKKRDEIHSMSPVPDEQRQGRAPQAEVCSAAGLGVHWTPIMFQAL
jgi:hypothetical protein